MPSASALSKSKLKRVTEYERTEIDRSPGSKYVTMDNALNRSGHGLTLVEKRMVALAASQINSLRLVNPDSSPMIKIRADEYGQEFNVDMRNAYLQLKEGAKNLYKRSIVFFEPVDSRGKKLIKPIVNDMRWVSRARYHEGEGWVEMRWSADVIPFLTGLSAKFTSYQLQQASALRSIYSWRLLELMMQFKSTGWAQYSIEEFATAMDATKKQQENFAAIRRKIIEPAVKELTEKEGWLIEWKPIKKGRRVAALRFEFGRNPQGRLL